MASRKNSTWGGPRPGAGRKPIPASERRRKRVVVALTDDQFAKLKQAADDAGYHVGAFAYTIVTDWLAKH